ncbi:MAG TPA: ankyrin repeat domain-containing protein [Myxococcales bacterium]|jgi:ankyrin repeat protein|nr:ankyrin repeat domain-containing protein [Myxococcales bacterium]
MLIALALATADPTAFLAAVRAQDLARVERMLAENPSLASARDEKGSAVGAALGARRGDGFVPRRQNRVLDAVLRHGPKLTPWEICAIGTAEQVRAEISSDPALVKTYAPNGWTPLHAAAFADNAAAAALLLAAGAEVNARAKNKFDNTPLQVAMLSQASDAAKVLIAHGAEVDARMSEGATALHEAAMNGDVVSIRMLLAAGADPSLTMPDGKTAVDLAKKAKHQEAARVLQTASAKKR